MGDRTKIEWTHFPGYRGATWNPVVGCNKVSQGCKNCYAERMALRFPKVYPKGFGVDIRVDRFDQPLRWAKPRAVFVCSMSDLFHADVSDATIQLLFSIMASSPDHIFMVLTKRADRMWEFFTEYSRWVAGLHPFHVMGREHLLILTPASERTINLRPGLDDAGGASMLRGGGHVMEKGWTPHNIFLGVTAENQEMAEERIPILLSTPAALRFVSCEPLLGPVRLDRIAVRQLPSPEPCDPTHASALFDHEGLTARLDWVIAGGESGPKARPMRFEWAFDLQRQCGEEGVPFFMKQMGEWCPEQGVDQGLIEAGGYHYEEMFGTTYVRLGRKAGIPMSLNVKEFPDVPEREPRR